MLCRQYMEEKAALVLTGNLLYLVQEHIGEEEGWHAETAAALLELLLLGKRGKISLATACSKRKSGSLLHSLFA